MDWIICKGYRVGDASGRDAYRLEYRLTIELHKIIHDENKILSGFTI